MLIMLYILVCICFLKLIPKVITVCGERRSNCFVLLISKEMTSGSKTVRRAYKVGTTFPHFFSSTLHSNHTAMLFSLVLLLFVTVVKEINVYTRKHGFNNCIFHFSTLYLFQFILNA